MAEPMQQQAERYLGTAIEPQEWRREPGYMAQLIAEAVRSDRLRRLTAQLADCYMGTKKDSPCPKTQGRPSTTHIVA